MESLSVKYRPTKFEEVCSQESIIKILKKQIETDQIKNCYLFCGASGCGKTTVARIFAKEINKYLGAPIEIDGASNNGVDSVKQIIASASERSLDGGQYKIYIVDECFPKGSFVKTATGYKDISEIKIGDEVATLTGYNKVTHVHKKVVKNSEETVLNLIEMSNGDSLKCTSDHLILTTSGWIKAKDLKQGDQLIDYENLSLLWKGNNNNKERTEVLQQQLSNEIPEVTRSFSKNNYKSMRDMWKYFSDSLMGQEANLLEGVQEQTYIAIREDNQQYRIWIGAAEIILSKNEGEQPYDVAGNYSKDASDERIEWYSSHCISSTGREWNIYPATDEIIQRVREFLGIGSFNKNRGEEKQQSKQVSILIQSRPWLQREEISDRGGWQFASIERRYTERFEENDFIRTVRVKSVKILQQTDRRQYSGSSEDYTELYDLTVENSPTYFVNDILVHNCHMLTTQAWNAFLKCIEEPPTYTIFIFCTTDPQKIPSTILNRCMRFNFNRINSEIIKKRLISICMNQGYSNYEDTCDYISRICSGQMRDAISLIEKCADYNIDLSLNNALEALGNYSYDIYFKLINALIDGDINITLEVVSNIYQDGGDLKLFIDQFLTFCLDICKYSLSNNYRMTSMPSNLEEELRRACNFNDAPKYYGYVVDKLLALKNMLKNDSSPKSTIEVMLMDIARCQ